MDLEIQAADRAYIGRLLIGTANPSKLPYLCTYFEGTDIECVAPSALGLSGFDAPENARTAEENAIEKALGWHRVSGMPVFALDAGLVLLDLPDDHPDQPGVHVRRAGGHVMDDEEMLWWFAKLSHKHGGRLRAAWQDSYCLLRDETHYHTYTFDRQMLAARAFYLADTPCSVRVPGWPLNSLEVDIATGKYAELMTAQDRAVSDAASDGSAQANYDRLFKWIRATALNMFTERG